MWGFIAFFKRIWEAFKSRNFKAVYDALAEADKKLAKEKRAKKVRERFNNVQ